jgi:pimeloyl-ACP methyl ester carboxylesterase
MAKDTARPLGRETYDGLSFKQAMANGVNVHYREAGDPQKKHLVLLHGFPSTSRMWDRLIPGLAANYHLIAPDYPGFGLSDAPPPDTFAYTFDNIALTMRDLLRQLQIKRYTILMQDYGGPIGFRMAMTDPDAITAIISQNAAAYDAALGPTWDTRKAFWKDPDANRAALQKNLLSLEAARLRHVGTSPNIALYDPNNWNDEFAMLNRPGMAEIHTALFYDYRNNVASYPIWQAWLRAAKPRMQVVWGRYDASFMVEGTHGFGRDNPNCETHILDASHFPLDEKPDEVRALHLEFLSKYV